MASTCQLFSPLCAVSARPAACPPPAPAQPHGPRPAGSQSAERPPLSPRRTLTITHRGPLRTCSSFWKALELPAASSWKARTQRSSGRTSVSLSARSSSPSSRASCRASSRCLSRHRLAVLLQWDGDEVGCTGLVCRGSTLVEWSLAWVHPNLLELECPSSEGVGVGIPGLQEGCAGGAPA